MRHSIILFIVILMSSIGCDNTTESKLDSFIYPLTIGNTWNYERQFKIYNVRPDSLKDQFEYAYTSVVEVTVTKMVDLTGYDNTIEMMAVETSDFRTVTGYNYYLEQNDGMYLAGYKSAGDIGMPKQKVIKEIRLAGHSFSSFAELLSVLTPETVLFNSKQDSVYLENPPVKVLEYPLTEGKNWTFRPVGPPWRIDKEIIGNETIETDAGSFECFKIRWLYDLDANGIWDTDIFIIDYLAEEGLVKRVVDIRDVPTTIGPFDEGALTDYLEEFTLMEYSLK